MTPPANVNNPESLNNAEGVVAPNVVEVENMSFEYFGQKILNNINFTIKANEKVLLIGPNGAGKSTLLRMIAGLHISFHHDKFDVLGTDRPNDQRNGLCYLGNRWEREIGFAGTTPYRADIAAGKMMESWQDENKERRDELVKVLQIDLSWKMHQVSDGQRKKVQLMIALLKPFRLAILDEFISELDVVVRHNLMVYLEKEVKSRNGAIVYATHVFDNLDLFFDRVVCIGNGTLQGAGEPMQDFIQKWGKDYSALPSTTVAAPQDLPPTLFMAVYNKLRKEEEEGNTKLEQPQVLDTSTFAGSGIGSGRGKFAMEFAR